MEIKFNSTHPTSPTDTELLHELITYLTTFGSTLSVLIDNFREFAPFVVLEDGTRTDIAPVDALDNAANSLAAKCREIQAKRAFTERASTDCELEN